MTYIDITPVAQSHPSQVISPASVVLPPTISVDITAWALAETK